MKKSFDLWHSKKKLIETEKSLFFKERDIFWTRLGMNVGDEQNGKGEDFRRPVIIFRKFNNNLAFVIPLTSAAKNLPFYFEFEFSKNQKSYAILSQLRLIDTRRLADYMGYISKKDFELLKKSLTQIMKL